MRNKPLLPAALALVCAVGLATAAQAITLADLNAGASFSTPDGTLTFHDFSVTLPGGASNAFAGLDLSLIEVEALPSVGFGFKVLEFDAPLVVAMGQVGQLQLSYTVTANDALITGVGLRFTGTAMGTGAVARIDEVVSTSAGDVELHVIRASGGAQDADDSTALPAPVGEIEVFKDVVLASGTNALAQISEFEQRYGVAPIPEPGAFAIFAASLALVTTASRRRLL
jgi:hypothetical protein